jgi:hypothetical protein
MAHQRHLIHEQVLDLQFSSRGAAETWQAEAGIVFRQRIQPLLERCLDELCDPDTLIHLDTLEIDLGELDSQRLKLDLEEKTQRSLKVKLEEAIRKEQTAALAGKETAKTLSKRDIFNFFLRTGALPWWADPRDPEVLRRCVRYLSTTDASWWKTRLATILNSDYQFHRLLRHFSDQELFAVVKAIAGPNTEVIIKLYRDLERLAIHLSEKKDISLQKQRKTLWEGVLYTIIEDVKEETEIVRRLLVHVMTSWKISAKRLASSLLGMETAGYVFQIPLPEYMRAYQLLKSRAKPNGNRPDMVDAPELLEENIRSKKAETGEEVRIGTDILSPSADLFIHNAGLILLWPFLPRFFANLGLVQDKAFLDEAAQQRAVGVLQYLADGATEPPEYLLPLNKALCGLPLDAVYDAEAGRLEEPDLETADAFLAAVVQQAEGLGKISPEGFRSAFLQRAGLLGFEDGQWLLHVERETHDILLDRLPWSFRIVKLPWMERPMFVDW